MEEEFGKMEVEDSLLNQKNLEQKIKFEELYKQQEQERIANKEFKKQLDDQTKDPQEKMLVIQREFKSRQEALTKKMQVCKQQNLSVNDLFEDFNSMKKYFISTNHALTTFDKQSYKDQLDKLEKHLFVLKDMLCPRKKFKFSKRIKQNKDNKDSQNQQIIPEQQTLPKTDYVEQVPGISNKENLTISLKQDEIQSSFKLYNLKNCEIHLDFKFDNFYIKNVENCKIFVGPVKSSIFIDNCTNSEFNLYAQQLRIHHTHDSIFHIFSSSKSIIEHCTKLKFGAYNYQYENLQQQIQDAGFQTKQNLWRDIQDFNWLKQEKSPNFDLIEQ